jgi:hypothetical protein
MPKVIKTRSSKRKIEGGVMRQMRIGFIVTGASKAVNVGLVTAKGSKIGVRPTGSYSIQIL